MNMYKLFSVSRRKSRGQNLAEFALTVPFILAFMFFIVELCRAWWTYEGAKNAASIGAHVAASHSLDSAGTQEAQRQLARMGITGTASVSQVTDVHAYEATVTVQFEPIFGGMAIGAPGATITLIPDAFPITYTAITDYTVY